VRIQQKKERETHTDIRTFAFYSAHALICGKLWHCFSGDLPLLLRTTIPLKYVLVFVSPHIESNTCNVVICKLPCNRCLCECTGVRL